MNLIERGISLKGYNTFGIEAVAEQFAVIDSPEKLLLIVKSGVLTENKVVILGNGSNVLFVNSVVHGLVLLNRIGGTAIVKEDEKSVVIETGSGENWSRFVDYTVEKSLWGLENLSLIPGTAGAAPVQNIGAFGVEQKDSFQYLKAFNLSTGELKKFNNLECRFGYRKSFFKKPENRMWFVVSAAYKLSKLPKPILGYGRLKEKFAKRENISAKEISVFIKKIRERNIPDVNEYGNAGSFFKNPEIDSGKLKKLQEKFNSVPFYRIDHKTVKIPAAWLIEQCGWKGKRTGNAGVSKSHALILVNYGGATGQEILTLSKKIKNDVYLKFGIDLEPEVNIIN